LKGVDLIKKTDIFVLSALTAIASALDEGNYYKMLQTA